MIREKYFILPKIVVFHNNTTIRWNLRILLLKAVEALGCIFTTLGLKRFLLYIFKQHEVTIFKVEEFTYRFNLSTQVTQTKGGKKE